MRLPRLYSRFLGADDGMQTNLRIYIFMNGCGAVAVSIAFQIGRHAAVAVNTVVPVVMSLIFPVLLLFWRDNLSSSVFGNLVGIRADLSGAEAVSGCRILHYPVLYSMTKDNKL